MALLLKIVVPEKIIFEGCASSVIIPSTLGEIELLEGHLPILGILEPGAVSYKSDGKQISIAVDAGFFQLVGDQVLILTEAAVDVQILDVRSIEAAVQRAEEALAKAKSDNRVDDEEIERLDKLFRFQVAQKLIKQRFR